MRVPARICSAFFVWFALSALAPAQTSGLALPPEAQKSYDRALEAVKQQEWELGIKYFREALKGSPHNPPIYFNLGLANAKAGHEVIAIAWMHAYLAAASDSDRSAAIRSEIKALKQQTQSKIDKMLELAAQSAERLDSRECDAAYAESELARERTLDENCRNVYSLPEDRGFEAEKECKDKGLPDISQRRAALEWIASWRSRTYDLESAPGPAVAEACEKDRIRVHYLRNLLAIGDVAGAQAQLPQIASSRFRDEALYDCTLGCLIRDLLKHGDLEAARDAAGMIHDPSLKVRATNEVRERTLWRIIESNLKRKETDDAPIEEWVQLQSKVDLYGVERDIRIRQLITELVDFDLATARRYVNRISRIEHRGEALVEIALQQVQNGDWAAAKVTAGEIEHLYRGGAEARPNSEDKFGAHKLAVAKAIMGDYRAALGLVQGAEDAGILYIPTYVGVQNYIGFYSPNFDWHRDTQATYSRIAFVAAMNGKVKEAHQASQLPSKNGSYHLVEATTAWAQLLKERIGPCLDTLRRVPNGKWDSNVRKSQVLGLVFKKKLQDGDFRGAEDTLKLLPGPMDYACSGSCDARSDGARFGIDASLLLADAHLKAGASAESRRLLTSARQMAVDTQELVQTDFLFDRLERIADAQARVGDRRGSEATRALVPSTETQEWIKLALSLSTDKAAGNLDQWLEDRTKSASATEIPDRIASVAHELFLHLLKLRSLERKVAAAQ